MPADPVGALSSRAGAVQAEQPSIFKTNERSNMGGEKTVFPACCAPANAILIASTDGSVAVARIAMAICATLPDRWCYMLSPASVLLTRKHARQTGICWRRRANRDILQRHDHLPEAADTVCRHRLRDNSGFQVDTQGLKQARDTRLE